MKFWLFNVLVNHDRKTFVFFKTKDGHLGMGDKVVGLDGDIRCRK